MATILTPVSLWKNFDDALPLNARTVKEKEEDGVRYEYVKFDGRETGNGRVDICGIFAKESNSAAADCVFVIPDSADTVDEELIKMFVKGGYCVFMPDYRGEWESDFYTVYPASVGYANFKRCARSRNYVDERADKTCWYEWVAVCRYAYRYIKSRTPSGNIGVVGIRDGGEIAWKLIASVKFSCAVTVCAAGWKAYEGFSKFGSAEPLLNEERYRFIAGIDSQAYAPYAQCPVLMLCSTNDPRFDYDRAYDTFSRINEQYAKQSVIAYSVRCKGTMSVENTTDMFMFLDKNVKKRHVFLPKPSELTIAVDEEDNLVADAVFDESGLVEKFGLYMAENCQDSSIREWTAAKYKNKISDYAHRFYLDVYEKTSEVYAFCYTTYTNGFTVWSKIIVKKISGKFRNMRSKCRVMYTSKSGVDCFFSANQSNYAVGKMFFTDYEMVPQVVTKEKGVGGITSSCGLTTYRLNSPRYAASDDSILKLDVFCDDDAKMTFTMTDAATGEIFTAAVRIVGGVWQSVILAGKMFKTDQGVQLKSFNKKLKLSVFCKGNFAINNVMWL